MMRKSPFNYLVLGLGVWLTVAMQGWTQTPTPTPNTISFNSTCDPGTALSSDTLITNGNFTEGVLTVGSYPDTGWLPGQDTAVLRSESVTGGDDNYFLEFAATGSSISTVAKSSTYTRFTLSFCTMIPLGGQLIISVNGSVVATVPTTTSTEYNGQYQQDSIVINLSSGASQSERTIEFYYDAGASGASAYVDNIELVPTSSSGEEDNTPTPTVAEPTATVTPQGPSPTPTPTIKPGIATPTPTPGIATNSVQMTANPPMLVVSPDDFVSSTGNPRKQISLDLNVVGSNGEKIDILAIDNDATIRFLVDTRGDAEGIGVVEGFLTEGNYDSLTSKRIDLSKYESDYHGRAYFIPLKPYTGMVRVIVEIEYKGWANGLEEQRKIRGVVPIILQTDKSASLTNSTGSFNAVQNASVGRKAGDRGFRPDVRTNLYFREKMK